MKIFVVGNSKQNFFKLDDIREKYLIDQKHEGDTNDSLNPWHCELTGLYYMWKNCNEDIVGLEHYRRFLLNSKGKMLNKEDIESILSKYDVIGTMFRAPINLIRQFKSNRICKEQFLFELGYGLDNIGLEDFRKYWFSYLKGKKLLQCNMFVCRKEIIDKYCEIFFNAIKDIMLTKDNKRIIGFLSEYMLGAWLEYNGYKIYYTGKKVLGKS